MKSSIEQPGLETRMVQGCLCNMAWILAAAGAILILIGALVSPRDEDGRPVLLLREVRVIQDYRRGAQGWIEEMTRLEGQIALVLNQNQAGDLFSEARAAQSTLEQAVAVVRLVDRSEVPPVGAGVHEEIRATALAYLEASRMALRWISAPQEETLIRALDMLELARASRSALQDNPWLTGA